MVDMATKNIFQVVLCLNFHEMGTSYCLIRYPFRQLNFQKDYSSQLDNFIGKSCCLRNSYEEQTVGKNVIGERTWNIVTPEWKGCLTEIEFVTFVINKSEVCEDEFPRDQQ